MYSEISESLKNSLSFILEILESLKSKSAISATLKRKHPEISEALKKDLQPVKATCSKMSELKQNIYHKAKAIRSYLECIACFLTYNSICIWC